MAEQPIPLNAVDPDKAAGQLSERLLPMLLAALPSLKAEGGRVEDALVALRAEFKQELSSVSSRFEAVQRHALIMVEEAREQARYWKEEASRLKTTGRETEEGYRRAMYAAQERASRLEGQLDALTGSPTTWMLQDTPVATAAPAGRLLPSPPDISHREMALRHDPDGASE